ncbi:hypothetical protein N7454_007873 [Penicillium verhagenii]|nr:hypothetical protein N7454_007873 [Penicillium verhagenii]
MRRCSRIFSRYLKPSPRMMSSMRGLTKISAALNAVFNSTRMLSQGWPVMLSADPLMAWPRSQNSPRGASISTVPKYYAVASEAATLILLRAYGVPVPKVNAVGTEYILLEQLEGTLLSEQWFFMDTKTRVKIMRQIVDVERRFMSIYFPVSGSLYYPCDLDIS